MKHWKYDGEEWCEVKEPDMTFPNGEGFWIKTAIYLLFAALVGAAFFGIYR